MYLLKFLFVCLHVSTCTASVLEHVKVERVFNPHDLELQVVGSDYVSVGN